jgi:RNA-splicing ligase RtcB
MSSIAGHGITQLARTLGLERGSVTVMIHCGSRGRHARAASSHPPTARKDSTGALGGTRVGAVTRG